MEQKEYSAREAAFLSLLRCEKDKKYSNLEVDSAIRRFHLTGAERGLYTALVYGVIERRISLDYFLAQLSAKELTALDDEILTALRLGLYQLIWLDRIPESAAVNESVTLIKKRQPRAASFVNAVLRGFLRKMSRDNLPWPTRADGADYLSVRYSCGEDVCRILSDSCDDPEALLAAFHQNPPITLRVNTLKTTREALLERLAQDGISAGATAYSPVGIRLGGSLQPQALAVVHEGLAFVQDEASQLAVLAADPKPGQTVIDSCACPGGKSFSAAMAMENTGILKSFDLHKNKLSLVENGARSLGISILTAEEKNGSVFDAGLEKSADVLICDAPCSGLGVIAKKPEIRYKGADEIERLPAIQTAILANVSRYVKPGGVLCYSTCTLNRRENGDVVRAFLDTHGDYAAEDFEIGGLASKNGQLTLYPHIDNTDGFFIAKFRRKDNK